ncbi:hypothetical protein FH972_022910 [Carpinus fangiana]|uniref:ATP adenylyltransferase C-terminal domain-containing protein n=1 Tax=Carpinus fangiana TaxID=176857 RepID=A0A5N6KVV8_9ROSI|nr:hypothetical protein FH972_022910 [Carpinus fangiana]
MARESDDYGMDHYVRMKPPAGSRLQRHWIIRWFTPNILALLVAFCFFLGWLLAAPTEHFGPKDITDPSKPPSRIDLPRVYAIVQEIVFEKFDDAAHAGYVHYDPVAPEFFSRNDFNWHFITSPILGAVPDHFTTEEDIAKVNETHVLSLARRSPYRPTMLLKPTKSEYSTEDINKDDILAATAVLRSFHPPMVMAVSVGENAVDPKQKKAMRIFAAPADFELWPGRAWSDFHPTFHLEGIPFRHFVLRLHPRMPGKDVVRNFNRVLAECKKVIGQRPEIPGLGYTIAMSKDWIVAIPRRHPGLPPNDAPVLPEVMLGLVSVGSQEERDYWDTVGYEMTLREMGVAFFV